MTRLALAAALFALTASGALAANPDRPIKLIVPWAAGGDTDSIYRAFGPHFQKHLGGTVVIPATRGGSLRAYLESRARVPPRAPGRLGPPPPPQN